MADFPSLTPSTRAFIPAGFPVSTFRAYSGSETRVRRGAMAAGYGLSLSFSALTPAEAKSIRDHYITQQGGFASFNLPAVIWSGITGYADLVAAGYRWIYAGPPEVQDVSCGYQTVSVNLRGVYDYAVLDFTPGPYAGTLTPTDESSWWDRTVTGACELKPEYPPADKWLAYTTTSEGSVVNSHTCLMDDSGFVYSFIAGSTNSELTRFKPTGEVAWTRAFTSSVGQFSSSSIKTSQEVWRLPNGNLLVKIDDKNFNHNIANISRSGNVNYIRSYDTAGGWYGGAVSNDGSKVLFSEYSFNINVLNAATGAFEKRIAFTKSGTGFWVSWRALQRPDGNWVFNVPLAAPPYQDTLIETDSTISNVVKAVQFGGVELASSNGGFCYCPDMGGYLMLGTSGGAVHRLDDNLNLVETRTFAGWPRRIQYAGNGDYYIWTNYVSFYGVSPNTDLGISGWPKLVSIIKYNWVNDYVHFYTVARSFSSDAPVAVNAAQERLAFTPDGAGLYGGGSTPPAYRSIASMALIQPATVGGEPIVTPTPPNYSFAARSLLEPTTRPTIGLASHTRTELSVGITTLASPAETTPTFTIAAASRAYDLIKTEEV